MMKKFFYLSAILAIVLVSCNSEKEYIAKLSNTASMIEKEADLSEAITLHYCDTWRKVIYDHEYNGEYCTDFNEALAKHQEFIITTDTYKRLKQKRDSIEAIMPQLNDYPSSCKDAYNELVSIYAKGELEGCIGEFLLEIVNVLDEGNIVQMGDLGNFRMSIKTGTPTDTAKEFKASCIDKGKVLFYPGSDLRKLCKTLDYTLYKSDSSTDLDKDPLPDDGGDDNQGGSGSGEAPDPAA